MRHVPRRGWKLFLATVLVAWLGAAFAAPALAATPRIVATTLNPNPVQYTTIYVNAKVLDSRGRAVKNANVAFTWTIDSHVYKSSFKTNARGVAAGHRYIGGATPWRVESVAVRTVLAGKILKAGANFQPLPQISAGHPVFVRIGVAGPLTAGAKALGAGMKRGAILAIEQFDTSSTVTALGLYFMGMNADDKGDPKTAAAEAKHLIADPRLLAVEGHLNSGCSIPASKVYASVGAAMITPASTNPALTRQGLANVFRTCGTDAWQGPKGASAAYALGYRKAYIVDDSTPYGEGLAGGFRSGFIASGGSVPGSAKTSDKDTDFTALVEKIKAMSPDIVYYGGIYNAGALFAKQLHDAGVSAPVFGGDGLFDPTFIALGGAAAVDGDLCTSVGYPADHLPNGAAFVSAFGARYPGVAIGPYDAYAYDATCVMLSAIVTEAKLHGAAVVGLPRYKRYMLAQIAATHTVGATGPISFDSHGDRVQQDIALYKVVSGAWAYQGIH